MISGTVKSWNTSQGLSFIEGDDCEDYFIHVSKVRKGQSISHNIRMEFDISQGRRGPEADNVTLY